MTFPLPSEAERLTIDLEDTILGKINGESIYLLYRASRGIMEPTAIIAESINPSDISFEDDVVGQQ